MMITLNISKYVMNVKSSYQRETSTYKQGCCSYISISQKLQNNVPVLRVVAIKEEHNHPRNLELFNHMTKQRKTAIANKNEHLQKVLAVKSNLRAVQNQVNVKGENEGVILLKDLHNFKSKTKGSIHQNDLVQLVEEMSKIENATVKIIHDEQKQLDCIFFQDSRMKNVFEIYPDLLMIDGTYKLNDRRMPLVVMLIVDGNGESQIAGLCIVKSENERTFRHLFEEFKSENPKYIDINVIISDKSFANRNSFKASFPHAHHQLCVFHVLQIFNREVTTKKRDILKGQRSYALKILRKMVYAQDAREYTQLYNSLVRMNCPQLLLYFNENWHNIQDQWVGYLINSHANYENRTNNRLESLNQKIKMVVSKYARLGFFFNDLMTCIASFNLERDHVAADSILRKSLATAVDSEYDKKYSKLLTKYAYDRYKLQSMKAEQVQFMNIAELNAECVENNLVINVSDEKCSCVFFNTVKLPCAHLIAFWNYHEENAYKPSVCDKRWRRAISQFITDSDPPGSSQVELVQQENRPRLQRNLTPNEKFRRAEIETKKICELMSEKSHEDFRLYFAMLKQFRINVERDILPGGSGNVTPASNSVQDEE